MRNYKLSVLLVTFALITSSIQDGKKDNNNMANDINAYAEMASDFLKNQNPENVGGLINDFMQSEGGKQLGDMLINMGNNKNGNQILESLGNLISPKESGNAGMGFDPALLVNVLSALNTQDQGNNNNNANDNDDLSNILSMVGGLMGGQGGGGGGLGGIMSFAPMLLSTLNSFSGEQLQKRRDEHADHSWFMPPVLEKIHLYMDHFMNSETGRMVLKQIASEKIIKVFTDNEGKFRFAKFAELLENHSFRKHWIRMVTKRIATIVSFFADAKTLKRFMTTVQYFSNNFLKTQGFPKAAMFDPNKPTETLTAFVNFFAKKYLGYKTNSKQYVKPAVEYAQDVVRLAQQKGFFTGRGVDSTELSDKLTDTINLEIIEPVARVYRAYRFAKKHPQCDRYVMCLVNQEDSREVLSLPGLKSGLSKANSLVASWFLSGHTGTSFWSLYSAITNEIDCKTQFVDVCNDFHVEEIRVTTEYVHNEL